jgi:ATP-binding cassette, subfamily B, bacterial MsbA
MPQIPPVIATLLAFASPYRWRFPLIVALGLAASVAEGFGIGLLIPLLDTLVGDATGTRNSRVTALLRSALPMWSDNERLAFLGVAIILLVMLRTIVIAANLSVAIDLVGRTTRDLRIAACRQLLSMGFASFAETKPGKLLNVMDAQTDRTSDALLWLTTSAISFCTVIVFFGLLVALSWELATVVALCLAPAYVAVQRVSRIASSNGRRLVDDYGVLIDRNLELVNSMRTIRAFNQEAFEEQRFGIAANRLFHSFRRTETLVQLIQPVAELLYLPAFLAVLAYAWLTGIPASVLLVFLLLLYRMQPALKRLDQARVTLSSLSPAVMKVSELLSREDKMYIRPGCVDLDGPIQQVTLESASFTYPSDDRPAVRDVSLAIRKGEIVAIIGKSGSGKSTIVNLLFRFVDPDGGCIRVNGLPIEQLDVGAWRRRLALAGQDADLMSGSIRDNILFGLEGAAEDDVRAAIELAGAADLVERLPRGLDTVISSRGIGLSGGERQRIALARALLRKPELLVLDEATNAVDSATEGGILAAIEKISENMAVLLITHRLSTITMADRALVISDGSVVCEGSPGEVLATLSREGTGEKHARTAGLNPGYGESAD